MAISMPNIPPNTLLPLFYAEVTSAFEPVAPNLRMCLIGQMNKGSGYDEGSATENYPYLLSGTNAVELFGRGSMLARMYSFARANAPFAEIWGVAIPENEGSFRTVMRITVTRGGSSTFYGTGVFFIDGQQVPFPIVKDATPNAIAKAITQAIGSRALSFKPIIYVGNTVDVGCRWMGGTGNMINFSYVGCNGRADLQRKETWLARNCLTFSRVTDGSGENTAASAYAQIKDRPFDVFVIPYGGGAASYLMSESRDFMDHDSGRWAPNRQRYGHMFCAIKNNNLQSTWDILDPHNDPHMSMMVIKNSVLPPWAWASALGGVATVHWAAPPELSRPLQTLELNGCCCGTDDDESWTRVEKQTFLEEGGTTITVRDDHSCVIDRVRTLKKRNDYDDPDVAWADAITMFQAQFFVKQMRQRITSSYPRAALSSSPTGIYGFTSPAEIRSVIVHEYKRMQAVGLVENADLFARYLVVERNEYDANRVDVLMRPDFINQLRVVAALVETHLQIDATDPSLLIAA